MLLTGVVVDIVELVLKAAVPVVVVPNVPVPSFNVFVFAAALLVVLSKAEVLLDLCNVLTAGCDAVPVVVLLPDNKEING